MATPHTPSTHIHPIEGETYQLSKLRYLMGKPSSTLSVGKVGSYLFNGLLVSVPSGRNGFIWYEFTGHHWKLTYECQIRIYLGKLLSDQYLKLSIEYQQEAMESDDRESCLAHAKFAMDMVHKLCDHTFAHKIIDELGSWLQNPDFITGLDTNPNLVGFENGVYDLSKGEFRDGKPDDMISLSTGNQYLIPMQSQMDEVSLFLRQIFPDPATAQYILILLASFLYGGNPHEKFHIWTGVGGNGKSKLMELFEKALGNYSSKLSSKIFTQTQSSTSSSASPEIARLKGIRAVSSQEPDDSKHHTPTINTGIMKELTGGDKLPTRALYGSVFDMVVQFKIIFCCNHLPDLSADDEGSWRRLSVIPFTSRFVANPTLPCEFKRDDHLSLKLEDWKETFMYMLLQMYPTYLKEGLIEPSEVKQATRAYRHDVDDLKEFLDQTIEPQLGSYVTIKTLWDRYSHSEVFDKNMKLKEFRNTISQKLGLQLKVSTTRNGKSVRYPMDGWALILPSDEVIDQEDVGGCKL